MITTAQAAALVGRDDSTIRHWHRQGLIAPKAGRKPLMWDDRDVWLAARSRLTPHDTATLGLLAARSRLTDPARSAHDSPQAHPSPHPGATVDIELAAVLGPEDEEAEEGTADEAGEEA